MTSRSPLCWLAWLGTVLLMLTSFPLPLDVATSTGADRILRGNALVGRLVMSAAVCFGAFWLSQRQSWSRDTIWIVMGVTLALRALTPTAQASLSTPIHRCGSNGRVQAAGVNPYGYILPDAALLSLQDTVIHPQFNCVANAYTIGPPGAPFISTTVGKIRHLPIQVPAAVLLLVELRPQRVTNLRRPADIGDPTCPLQLA
jgi:alpha-1,6-mannosyltransferase